MEYVQLTSHLPLLTKVVQVDPQFPSPQGLDPQPLCHLLQACPVKQNGTERIRLLLVEQHLEGARGPFFQRR